MEGVTGILVGGRRALRKAHHSEPVGGSRVDIHIRPIPPAVAARKAERRNRTLASGLESPGALPTELSPQRQANCRVETSFARPAKGWPTSTKVWFSGRYLLAAGDGIVGAASSRGRAFPVTVSQVSVAIIVEISSCGRAPSKRLTPNRAHSSR